MIHSFTTVKKSCVKNTGFISRILGVIPNIDETRAIYGVEIRDTDTSKSQTMHAPVGGQAGDTEPKTI